MKVGDRVGYSDKFLSLLPKNRKHDLLTPGNMRGHVRRVNGEYITVHWDDGRRTHHHKVSIQLRK